MKKTLFLVFSAAILIFTIISICCAPIINGDIIGADDWKTKNCKLLEDEYKLNKNDANKKAKNLCNRQKAMYGLEYSSLIIDVVLGFICAILGLLHYFDVAKPFEKISGIIGLSTGIIGFILTLVYICYSGYIFTNDTTKGFDNSYKYYNYPNLDGSPGTYINSGPLIKLDKEGAFAEWDDSKGQYKLIFYKENNPNSIYPTYSDLGKKQYNYEKKRFYDRDTKYTSCLEAYSSMSTTSHTGANCKYLYLSSPPNSFKNKYVFDRWVSTIIFSCFILVCCIGLAIFGFLLFKSDSSGL